MAKLKENSTILKSTGEEIIATEESVDRKLLLKADKDYVDTQLAAKVDKVAGKGLSTNDYTDEEKQKNQDNADNISNLQQELETHKAESASKHITESGSNTNGRYIKFDDGTMICTRRIAKRVDSDASEFFDLPAHFINEDNAAAINPIFSAVAATAAKPIKAALVGAGKTQWRVRVHETYTGEYDSIPCILFAIGRWK